MSRRSTEKSLALPETAATIRQDRRIKSLKKHKKQFDEAVGNDNTKPQSAPPAVGSFDFYRQCLGLGTTVHPKKYIVIGSSFDRNSDERLLFALKKPRVTRSRSMSSDYSHDSSQHSWDSGCYPRMGRGLPPKTRSLDRDSAHSSLAFQRIEVGGPCSKLPPKTRSLDRDRIPKLPRRTFSSLSKSSGSVETVGGGEDQTSLLSPQQQSQSHQNESSMRKACFKSMAIPKLLQESLEPSLPEAEEKECEFEMDLGSKLTKSLPSKLCIEVPGAASMADDEISVCSSVSMDLEDVQERLQEEEEEKVYHEKREEEKEEVPSEMEDESLNISRLMDSSSLLSSTSFRWGGGSHRRSCSGSSGRRRTRGTCSAMSMSMLGMNNSCLSYDGSLGMSKNLHSRRRRGRRPSIRHSNAGSLDENTPAVFPTRIRRVSMAPAQA
jgi:hypothetical protein